MNARTRAVRIAMALPMPGAGGTTVGRAPMFGGGDGAGMSWTTRPSRTRD